MLSSVRKSKIWLGRNIKNPTPMQIALFSAVVISLVNLVLLGIFVLLNHLQAAFWVIAIFFILSFLAAYQINVYYLRKYIYRKVKVIYKTIRRHKLSKEEKSNLNDISTNLIEEVQREVDSWAQERTLEIEKLKSWDSYRRRFLGDISHELKTPVFNIQGYVETLLDGAMDDPNVRYTYLSKAANNLARLNTILDDLDAITRLESGELMLEMRVFDIKQLTQEIFEDVEIKANQSNVRLMFKVGADANFKVRADRESIRQVLTNLISNSIKYGKDGGETKVGFYEMDKDLLIEVADDGIGIKEEYLPHIFERFFRVDKSRSRQKGGSGLGLSIVKHIVEAHKHTINVRSRHEGGSTFGFTLDRIK